MQVSDNNLLSSYKELILEKENEDGSFGIPSEALVTFEHRKQHKETHEPKDNSTAIQKPEKKDEADLRIKMKKFAAK